MYKIEAIHNFIPDYVCDITSKRYDELKDHRFGKDAWKEDVPKDHDSWHLGTSGQRISAEIGQWRLAQREVGFNRSDHLKKYNEILQERIVDSNTFMWNNFHPIYNSLLLALQNHLKSECIYLPHRATLPGFQMYDNIEGEFKGRGWHYDDGKQCLTRYMKPYFDGYEEPEMQYSITLGVELPKYATFEYYSNTGGDYTDITIPADILCDEHNTLRGDPHLCSNPNCPILAGKAGELITLPLLKGTCILQTGRFMHRAGRGYHRNREEKRLTLQAHAVKYPSSSSIYVVW